MPTKADTSRVLASLDETLASPDPFPHPAGLLSEFYTDPHDPVRNARQMANLDRDFAGGRLEWRERPMFSVKYDNHVLHGYILDHAWNEITLDDWSIVEACRHVRRYITSDDSARWLAVLQRRSQARINLGVGGWYPYEKVDGDGT